jgi:hypothetical protein
MLLVEERLERGKRGVQPEEAIEIDGGIGLAGRVGSRAGDGDGRAQVVISLFAVRNYYVQPVGSAALEYGDQNFLASGRGACGIECALEPQRRGAHADHGERGIA